jgi:flagellar hook assembly protein FlgD
MPEIKICLRSGSVAFVWDAARQSSVRVSLFDVSGRLIRELSRNAGAGQPAVIWDGLDNTGKPVPCGCYTIQVRYKDKNSAQRFVLSRR